MSLLKNVAATVLVGALLGVYLKIGIMITFVSWLIIFAGVMGGSVWLGWWLVARHLNDEG